MQNRYDMVLLFVLIYISFSTVKASPSILPPLTADNLPSNSTYAGHAQTAHEINIGTSKQTQNHLYVPDDFWVIGDLYTLNAPIFYNPQNFPVTGPLTLHSSFLTESPNLAFECSKHKMEVEVTRHLNAAPTYHIYKYEYSSTVLTHQECTQMILSRVSPTGETLHRLDWLKSRDFVGFTVVPGKLPFSTWKALSARNLTLLDERHFSDTVSSSPLLTDSRDVDS